MQRDASKAGKTTTDRVLQVEFPRQGKKFVVPSVGEIVSERGWGWQDRLAGGEVVIPQSP